jgi:DNA-directed RNA polymerase specialized sigma24 family protein
MDRDTFRKTERRLYDYPLLVARLNEVKLAIIEASPTSDTGPVSHAVSDPTGGRAATLCDNAEVCGLTVRLKQVTDAMAVMTSEQRELVRMKYHDSNRLSDAAIAERLHISLRTYHRWREDAVRIVATRLGYLHEEE